MGDNERVFRTGVVIVDEAIRAKAEELGQLLAGSDVFLRFEKARSAIDERSAVQLMLRDFAGKLERLQLKSMTGEEISEAEMKDLERSQEIVNMNPYISEYLQAADQFQQTWTAVIGILSEAVGLEAPNATGGEQEPQEDGKQSASAARSRLWVPGDNS